MTCRKMGEAGFFVFMALTIHEQIKEHIKSCHAAIIVLPEQPSADAITSALTLRQEIQKLDKKIGIACHNFKTPDKLKFLKNINSIESDISLLQKSVIQIDTSKHPISDLSYEKKGDMLQILLSPKSGSLPKEAVEIKSAAHTYDLIIAINTTELEALGGLYKKYQFFFDQTPIINIDHRPDNEQYAQINWVDINATSTSEMMFNLFYKDSKPEKDIATALLTGIMDETHSFRTHRVNPETLKVVSQILKAEAEHETVVNHLYRTKTVGLLRLWGHVLDNLQADRELSLAWSVVPESIFSSTGTSNQQLRELMDEILSHSPEAKTVVLLLEKSDSSVEIQITTKPPLHAKDLIKNWQPYGSERMAIALINNGNLAEAEKEVIKVVKQRLSSLIKA